MAHHQGSNPGPLTELYHLKNNLISWQQDMAADEALMHDLQPFRHNLAFTDFSIDQMLTDQHVQGVPKNLSERGS